jgi:EAL domain-containing protein (putative c-di-GMP-specific phosphodiesterase class I)
VLRVAPERHIVVFPLSDPATVEGLLAQLAREWAAGVKLGAIRVAVDVMVGISVSPTHGSHANELLRRAAAALREARRQGSAVQVYRDGLEESHARRRTLRRDIQHAIARRQLSLVYQPQLALRTRRIGSFEALLRWRHPEFGEVTPGEFIPICEEAGHITQLSEWVLHQASAQIARWRSENMNFRVAVNLSALDLAGERLDRMIGEASRVHEVSGRSLTLELTEHAVVADLEHASAVMGRAAQHGVSFSLDDFGTGHASLKSLRALPLSEIKVDRSFTRNLTRGAADEVIVQSAVSLAHALRLQVVAEGLETAQSLLAVTRLGCDRGQGYFIGRPMSASRVKGARAGGSAQRIGGAEGGAEEGSAAEGA